MTTAEKSAEIARAMGLPLAMTRHVYGTKNTMACFYNDHDDQPILFDPFTSWDDAGMVIEWVQSKMKESDNDWIQMRSLTPARIAEAAYNAVQEQCRSCNGTGIVWG